MINQARRSRYQRGNALLIIIALVVIAALAWVSGAFTRDRANTNHAEAHDVMGDPKTMLNRFFVLRGQNYSVGDHRWETLLDFMSVEDKAWMEANLAALAAAGGAYGSAAAAELAPEEDRRFAAAQHLLQFKLEAPRLVVSTVDEHSGDATVYVHEPNHAETLHPIYIVREADEWHIRRFLGRREDDDVIGALAKDKQMQSHPLDDDEKAWLAKPGDYKKAKEEALAKGAR